MPHPVNDPHLLTALLGRNVVAVEEEEALGMTRVVALELEGGLRFALPAGNALRSAGELAEIRALLWGLPRQVAEALRRQIGPGDPVAAVTIIEASVTTAMADPDAVLEGRLRLPFPMSGP